MGILLPILILGGLGVAFGAGLAFASKKLEVKNDPRLDRIMGLLPGANCGACGGAGCFAFAEAVLKGEMDLNSCRASEVDAKAKIAEVLGKKAEKNTKKIAFLHCSGGDKVENKYAYDGIKDCLAASQLLGGPKKCYSGCIGFASCAAACPFGAINMDAVAGLPVVDALKCRSCGKCAAVCPKRLFSLQAEKHKVYVACRSRESIALKRGYCKAACIACRKCEKTCPSGAIKVEGNLAVIDYTKCTSCFACVEACPVKVIKKR